MQIAIPARCLTSPKQSSIEDEGTGIRSPDELRVENARLIALLERHGIDWRSPPKVVATAGEPESSRLSTEQKVHLFRRLFRGRADVYSVRWESKASGKSGYSPACANEWLPGICEKPRVKCADCRNRSLIPLSDSVIYDHLAGMHAVGVYPLLEDDTCYFLAVDFDAAEWRDDARACTRLEFYWLRASWSAKALIIRRWTRWCWLCLSPGGGRCSNMLLVSTASTPTRLMFESLTSLTRGTLRCGGCGRSVSADTGR